jgi:Pyridoxamine 5'-phosphate oxidase like
MERRAWKAIFALRSRPSEFRLRTHKDRVHFKDSPKVLEITENQQTLVSYTRPSDYEFISVSGRARIVDDPAQIRALWSECFRVWFPDGPDSPNIALLAIDVEVTKAWTKPASVLTYAYYYLRARTTGEPPSPSQIAKQETIRT